MNNIYNTWFSTVRLSNKMKYALLEKYNAEELWNMDEERLQKVFEQIENNFEKNQKQIAEVMNIAKKNKMEEYYKHMDQYGITLICYKDNDYPSILRNIEDFPIYLYVRGEIKNLYKDNIAIVGSRNASDYGKRVAMGLSKYVCDRNVGVVSGLAIRN